MTDTPSRRQFLSLVGGGTAVTTAGCGDDSGERSTTAARRTASTTPTDEQPSTETADEDDESPTFRTVTLRVDDPQTTSRRRVTVTGEVEDASPPIELSLSVNGELAATDSVASGTEFSIATDFAGGTAYSVELIASDGRGNTQRESLGTRYVAAPTRRVGEDRLVGTHYYGWWGSGFHWNSGYDGEPVLGEYNSRDPEVLRQHLQWLRDAGINWISLSWWGRDSWSNETFEDHLLRADGIEDFRISILYESQKMLQQADGSYVTDFDIPGNRDQFVSDVDYLSNHYFHRDEYLRIDGKPVVYLYASSGFIGDFDRARREAEAQIGHELYLVGDFPFQKWPPGKARNLHQFDAIANYSAFYQPWENINELVPEQPRRKYTEWLLRTRADDDLDFIPTVSPGFDKTSHEDPESKELPILHESPADFAAWCRQTRGLMDPALNAVLVTSFNETHEGTQIEPGVETGTSLLEVVNTELRDAEFLHRNLDAIGTVTLEFAETVGEVELKPESREAFSRELAFNLSGLELANPSTGWTRQYPVSPGSESPFFIEGAFSYNPDWDRRWCGGTTGRTVLGFDWEDLSKATELRIQAAPQWELGDLTVTGGLANGVSESRTIRQGDPKEYRFPIAFF